MKTIINLKRFWAVPVVAAELFAFAIAPALARDANELMMKAVGTTTNVSPVIVEAIRHAAVDLTPDQHRLAAEGDTSTDQRPLGHDQVARGG